MDAIACIKDRRSVRVFADRPVGRDVIETVVDAASFAPSWKNTQITRYTAIDDKAVIAEIAEKYAKFNARILSTCPVLMALSVVQKRSGFERDGSPSTERGDSWQMFDCGIAAQTFCLAAHEAGLGTVIMGVFDRPALETYLEVPDGQELVALVAVGWPAENPSAPRRKSVEDLLTWK